MARRAHNALSLVAAATLTAVLPWGQRPAHADVPKGIFAETVARADDVTVRRFRDTETGVVCYVSSTRNHNGHGDEDRRSSISCLRGAQ